VCWRVIHVPRVIYIELLPGDDAEVSKKQLMCDLGLLASKPNTSHEDALSMAQRTFTVSEPLERATCAQVSYPLHSKQAFEQAPDPESSTTRRFRVLRVSCPWSLRIDWLHKKCAAWDKWRKRVHLEHATMAQRFLWDKDIGGACWLHANKYQPKVATAAAFSTCTTEYVVHFEDICRVDAAAAAPPPPPLWTLTFSIAQRHEVSAHPKAGNIFDAEDVHNDEFYTLTSAPIDSISLVLHATHLAPSSSSSSSSSSRSANSSQQQQQHANQTWLLTTTINNTAAPAPATTSLDFVTHFANEQDMLREFFERWMSRCDVLVGWQLQDIGLPLLLSRLGSGVGQQQLWSHLGRVAPKHLPSQFAWTSWYQSSHALPGGRLMCDAFRCCMSPDLFPPHNCATISQLEQTFLSTGMRLGSLALVTKVDRLSECARRALSECLALHMLLAQQSVVRVLFEVAQILGCRMRTNFDTTSKVPINDAALAREFVRAGFIVNHPPLLEERSRKHNKFKGGTWLEAQRGVHEMAFELDVEAMYSNIFLAGNICFSTLPLAALTTMTQPPALDRLVVRRGGNASNASALGVLPRFCQRLLESRARIREDLRAYRRGGGGGEDNGDDDERSFLEARRKAIKLGNNITYGCLGQPASKFSNVNMAALVAAFGRGLLDEAAAHIRATSKENDVHVIYGATDSLQLACGTRTLDALGALKTDAERRRHLEAVAQRCADLLCSIRPAFSWLIDGLFRRILLLEKNRFVAVVFGEQDQDQPSGLSLARNFIFKGVDITKGGMCQALSQLRREIFIDMVLLLPPRLIDDSSDKGSQPKQDDGAAEDEATEENKDAEKDKDTSVDVPYDETNPATGRRLSVVRSHITRRIKQWVESVKQGAVPTEHFVITQRLSQQLEAYEGDEVSQQQQQHGHVQAARLLHAAGANLCGVDQAIEYVWCTSLLATRHQTTQQAFPYHLVRKDTQKFFPLHLPWYVSNQLVPELARDIKCLGLSIDADRIESLLAILKQ